MAGCVFAGHAGRFRFARHATTRDACAVWQDDGAGIVHRICRAKGRPALRVRRDDETMQQRWRADDHFIRRSWGSRLEGRRELRDVATQFRPWLDIEIHAVDVAGGGSEQSVVSPPRSCMRRQRQESASSKKSSHGNHLHQNPGIINSLKDTSATGASASCAASGLLRFARNDGLAFCGARARDLLLPWEKLSCGA